MTYRRRESPQHYPDNDLVREHRALVWMPPVPPLGLVARAIAFVSEPAPAIELSNALQQQSVTVSEPPFSPASANTLSQGVELANGHLTVQVSEAGVRLVKSERTIANVLTIESSSDVGDAYTPAIRGMKELLRPVRFELAAAGPLRASVRVWYSTVGKASVVRIRATLSLDAGSDTLRVEIRGNNRRRDHRLRIDFHTDVMVEEPESPRVDVWADAAFGPVCREPLNVPAVEQAREMVPPTMPMHRWATLSSQQRGATLHADGLAEVEANAATGVLSLTLLRAIGELSRNNLPERPGHAGWPANIPLAQSQGSFRALIGLQLHDAWSQQTRDDIESASNALLMPLTGRTVRDLDHGHDDVLGPNLSGIGLRQSAVTLADDADGIVLRCVNDSTETRSGTWTLPDVGPLQFALARLDETLTSSWQSIDGPVAFTAPPRGVVTIRVRRPRP